MRWRRRVDAQWALRTFAIGTALLAIATFATWPLITHLGVFLNVDDPFISAWGLWWMKYSIFHLHNPWWTTRILAPDGSYLSFHALVPLAGIVLLPFTVVLGTGLTVNLTQLLLPIGSTLSGRALARELGLPRLAAWLAGGLYGFSVIVDWRTEFHMNFGFAFPLMPLAVLYAVRYTRTSRRRDALLSGAIGGLVIMTDPIMAFLTALAVACYVLVEAVVKRSWRPALRFTGWALLAAIVVGSPQLVMMARAATNGGYVANNPALALDWVKGSTSVLTMLSPGQVRSIIPGHLQSLAYRSQTGEATPAYGWGALGLTGCFLVLTLLFRRRPTLSRTSVAWALVLLLGASWLALGPQLRFGTFAHIPLAYRRYGQLVSPLMPYTWITYIPFFGDIHVPSRFTMLGILPLTMLAGAGFAQLRGVGRAGLVVACALALFGLLEAGFPDGGLSKQWVPMTRQALYQPIKTDRSRSIVVDVPLGFLGATAGAGASPGEMEPMFRATQHGHPIAEGYVTRLTQAKVNALVSHPLYAAVLAWQTPGPSNAPLPVTNLAAAAQDARRLDARWMVVWPTANRRVLRLLTALGYRLVRADARILLYRLSA